MTEENVGSLAQEAAKLFEVIANPPAQNPSQSGAGQTSTGQCGSHRCGADTPGADQSGADQSGADQSGADQSGGERSAGDPASQYHADTGSDTTHEHRCPHSWCPLCQLTEYMQNNPELISELTESASAFFASVRQVVEHISGKEES